MVRSRICAVPILLWILISTTPFSISATSLKEDSRESTPAKAGVPSATFGASQEPGLAWSGQVWANSRLYREKNTLEESVWQTNPRVDLSLEVKKEQAELKVKFRWEPSWQNQSTDTIFRRMIDEAYVRGFLGSTVFEAGYMKVVWGKGDDVHVLDLLNPTDYYDFVNNSYLDRRASQWMMRVMHPLGEMHNLELVWEPVTTPDHIPLEGPWKPYAISALEGHLQTLLGFTSPVAASEVLVSDQLSTLIDGTYGIRFTGSSHGFDYGILYAYTYNREPKVDLSRIIQTQKVYLSYDRIHCFGIEGATAWEGFNFRLEGGYFLTNDTKGTDPKVRNPSVGYVVGMDRDLWTDGPNLNLQVQGVLPLHTDKIDRNPLDVEYRGDGKYTRHILAGHLSDTILENKVKWKVSTAFGMEQQDLRIAPELTYEPFDDFQITARWVQYLGNRDTTFGQYKDSSFFEVSVSYRF
ncbi:MAG: hypothetical protein N2442_14310 [Spirochaetes bacterium]|nr:hypothetical protein [Spirochaetota bacterium]